MIELLFAFTGMLLIITIMSVGLWFGRRPIKGSCGGLGAAGVSQSCSLCGGEAGDCVETDTKGALTTKSTLG